MPMPILESTRLVLRPFHVADAPRVQQLAGLRQVAETTSHIPHPYPDGAAVDWIAGHEPAFQAGQALTLAMTDGHTGRLMGAVSLIDIRPAHRRAALGYWVGVDFWGRGFCTEAVQALMAYAEAEWQITRFVGQCFARNPASARVMEKCGMTEEGMLRRHACIRGAYEDIRVLARNLPGRDA
ncbi:hypothetical protein A9404_07815 [Halothiobacillus diazotrophicus]|uniref:N-acetyltransferase domain-containing protein n=1 Tax=Halothiobacillus diazotrophicus TaxID=1860122 RepID=A0A191ZHD4_9GAMM|nr:GNAT family N-acetyltransferase [Halothiobacillus diazotrophicus]ANJ67301.1 hypothetical protein A9404_07815 [Halothiobacillus diazotrophicus]